MVKQPVKTAGEVVGQFYVWLSKIQYKNWVFDIQAEGNRIFFQVCFRDETEDWKSRKWFLSVHSTKSEVIQTALKAVLTAEEHEVREKFLYMGKPIFGPHIDVDVLHAVCENFDVRG